MQNQARLSRYEPTERVSSGLRELQPSPPFFQQSPSFQALDSNPIHLSLEKLGFSDVFQRQLFRRAEAWLGCVWIVHRWPISLQDRCRPRPRRIFRVPGGDAMLTGNQGEQSMTRQAKARDGSPRNPLGASGFSPRALQDLVR